MTNPYQPPGDFDVDRSRHNQIQSLSNKSVIYGLVGLFCCGLIFGPVALNYASQAEAAIILDESGVNHGSTYKIGRALGYLAIVLWALSVVIRLANLLSR